MITVRGEQHGREVVRFPLSHGADPERELVASGWWPVRVVAEGRAPDLTLTYAVEPGPAVPAPPAVAADGIRRQRLAAYALVVAEGALLLTELSGRVRGGAGLWLPPGGGVEAGEEPATALVREVWEETGQDVDEVVLRRVHTSHRLDPASRTEPAVSFHPIRLVHTARCTTPRTPVVHDVGGSTASARWVGLDRVRHLPLVPWLVQLLDEEPDLLS
jgi:8-oxo-dGTP pyrophosphatase MutT (NUDIX family)